MHLQHKALAGKKKDRKNSETGENVHTVQLELCIKCENRTSQEVHLCHSLKTEKNEMQANKHSHSKATYPPKQTALLEKG